MPTRRALVIDNDEQFRELLRHALGPHGFEIRTAAGEDEWLQQLESARPDLIFVAVELPGREGFARFGRLKSAARSVPVALTTATLPPAELSVHEKLKVHADVYLDKRDLTPELLVKRLARFLDSDPALRGPPEGRAADAGGSGPDATASSDEEAWLAEFLGEGVDAEIVALLDSVLGPSDPLGAPEDAGAGGPDPVPEASSARMTELEAEIDRLRRELDDARREARSSPFAGDFLSMREVASSREAEIDRLRSEVGARNRKIAGFKEVIEKLARRLGPLAHERDEANERAEELQSRCENAEAEVRRAREQGEEFRIRCEQSAAELAAAHEKHERARQVHEHGLEELKASYAAHLEQAERRQADALAALEAAHREQLAAVERCHRTELAKAEQAGRELRDFAAAADELAFAQRAESLRAEHEGALAAVRAQHEEQIDALRAEAKKALAVRRRESEAAESRAAASERARAEAELAAAQSAHELAMTALKERFAEELASTRSAHQEALEAREGALRTELADAVAREKASANQRFAEAESQWSARIDALRERHAQEIAAVRGEVERIGTQAPPEVLQELEAERERARELEARLAEVMREMLDRDPSADARQQETSDHEEIESLREVIADLHRTIESLMSSDASSPDRGGAAEAAQRRRD